LSGLLVVGTLIAGLAGCGETTACQEAEEKGHGTHACFVENRQAEHELQTTEEHLHRLEGESKAEEIAGEKREFREGWEEAEREQEFWGE